MNEIAEDEDFEEEVDQEAGESSEEEDELVVEVEDDAPPEDQGRARRKGEPNIPDDEEIASYSDGVQKRIKSLKFEYHEERRRKEEAERLRDEAVSYAQRVFQENQRLEDYSRRATTAVADTSKGRIESELERARSSYRDAFDNGDSEAALKAQEDISRLLLESQRYEQMKSQASAPARAQQSPPQRAPEPDEKAKAWAAQNDWFEKDEVMTAAAYGIHQKLYNSGIQPGTEKYWEYLDLGMREAFPHKFQATQSEQPKAGAGGRRSGRGSVVASASRGGKNTRKVVLTASQAALIKRLNITPEQYISQMMKDSKND